MRSVLLVMRGKLRTTSLEANVASMMTGLTIDKMIRSVLVMEIVGDLMEPMDTSWLQKVADDLLSRSSAGGAGAGSGEGQHQAAMQPPAAV